MKTCGIYKITNKINQNLYIGKSIWIENRWQQHIYDALNRPKTAIDFAIRKYGIDNFTNEIIEKCSSELLNERERYWINYYNTYKGQGYNCTPGGDSLMGEEHPRAILTNEQVWDIREMYKNHCKFNEVKEKYLLSTGITERGLQKIWRNETWCHIHSDVYTPENKKWHETFGVGHSADQIGASSKDRALSQEEIDNIVKDYKEFNLSITELSKKYQRDYGIIEKYLSNPHSVDKVKYSGRQVQNIETAKIFSSISSAAKWAKCGVTTLTRHLYDGKKAGVVPDTQEPAHWKEII